MKTRLAGACNRHDRDEKCVRNFGRRDHLEDLGVDRRRETGWEGVDWMHLDQDRG
jgi:hypothetical protein